MNLSFLDPRAAQRVAERFDPFHDPYLGDPYPFLAEAREVTPIFYSPDLDYWVVTRYHDIRQIFQTPKRFSASNTLAPLQPICPAAGHLLAEGGFRPVPTLTNSDPPGHSRVRRLAHVAFTPRRIAAMESFVRELCVRFVEERLAAGERRGSAHAPCGRLQARSGRLRHFARSACALRSARCRAVETRA